MKVKPLDFTLDEMGVLLTAWDAARNDDSAADVRDDARGKLAMFGSLVEQRWESLPVPTQAALDAAMLTLADMPTGWRKGTGDESSSASASSASASASPSPTPSTDNPECSQKFGNGSSDTSVFDAAKSVVHASVTFEGPDLGATLSEASGVYATTATAQSHLAALKSASAKCTSWIETDSEGSKSTFTMSELLSRRPEMTCMPWQTKVKSDSALGLSVILDFVASQTKNSIVVMLQSEVAAVDPATLTKLAPIAVDRVNKAVAAA
jgi:hypothetical protein